MKLSIFVLNRSWNLVAEWEDDPQDFLQVRLGKSAVIRRWGTTKGLGELAKGGPTVETILDEEPPDGTIRKGQIIRTLPCNQKAWTEWMSK